MNMSTGADDRIAHIAHHLVVGQTVHGLSKTFTNENELNLVRSIGTERAYKQLIRSYLGWRSEVALPLKGPHTSSQMQEFLFEMESVWQQKQLDVCRQALQTVFQVKLDRTISQRITSLKARAYRSEEVAAIAEAMSFRHRIGIMLCFETGARAHELFTMLPASQMDRSRNRPWRADLFSHGGPIELYCVVGKGGLRRFIGVPVHRILELESLRLTTPRPVVDRGINYITNYDIGAGQPLSQSFSVAAKRALGVSKGLHGLRHSFAQRRMVQLVAAGMAADSALSIVSQEVGHFRPEITLTYLR